jgi:hypothetical protein
MACRPVDAPDVLGWRLEEARPALRRAGKEIASIVHTGAQAEAPGPLRVVRQRRLGAGKLDVVVAFEMVLRTD